MKLKNVLTVALLAFVGASVICFVVSQRGTRHAGTAAAPPSPARPDEPGRTLGPRLMAYYFHTNVRCPTCLRIEAYAKEAVETGFPDDLKSGRIVFRPVNVDEPANEHFIEDFKLVSKTVVVARLKDGKVADWRNLDKVWLLVQDKEAFFKYIQSNIRDLLKEGT